VSRAFEVFGFEPMIELIKRYSVACCIGLLAVTPLYAQEDTSRNEMGFDLGITRGWNIDLWPLLRIQKTEEKRDIQLVWPIFKYQTHFQRKENTTRLLPLFVADSSERIRDLRLGSVYYPSLFRFTNSYERQVKSFKLLELAPEINFFEVSRSLDGLFIKTMLFSSFGIRTIGVMTDCTLCYSCLLAVSSPGALVVHSFPHLHLGNEPPGADPILRHHAAILAFYETGVLSQRAVPLLLE
jgi:hypothetical protein